MANYGEGVSALGRYQGEPFDNGLPSHVILVLAGQSPLEHRFYGTAVIEKIGSNGRPVQLRSEPIWYGGIDFAIDVPIESDPFFLYRLVVWWKVAGEFFFWYHT